MDASFDKATSVVVIRFYKIQKALWPNLFSASAFSIVEKRLPWKLGCKI